jgi:peptidoglycan hydrolase-like protein with peptidoglycan-binding domain
LLVNEIISFQKIIIKRKEIILFYLFKKIMKKYLIGGLVALSLVLVAGAQSAEAATFTRSLTVGSTGADVVALQTFLEAQGDLTIPAGVSKGYFGALTKTAVSKFQARNGISPTAGYFGPITMAKVDSLMMGGASTGSTGSTSGTACPAGLVCTPVVAACPAGFVCTPVGGSTGSSSKLEGTNGSISDVNMLSQYSGEDVGEGQSDVKVVGFEVEASNDGDIALRSLKLVLDPTGNASGESDKLRDYVSQVKVWQGSKEVGSAKASEFTETSDDVWTKTITLSDSIVRADEIEKFYITLDAISNLDSGDIAADSWTVAIENIRYEDGAGVVSTETSAIDSSLDWDSAGDGVAVDFVDFAASSDTELKVTVDSSSPKAGIVIIDTTNNTDDVVLLVGKMEVEGTSDVTIDEFPVTLTTVGGANVSAVTGSLTLKIDGEEFTESVSITGALTGTVTFDNLDFTIKAGDTVKFTVLADINDIDTGNLDEGDTLLASVTSTNRDYIDAENEAGDQLSDSTEKSGTAIGKAQEFRTNGVILTLDSTSTSIAAGNSTSDDQGTFTLRFKVKAVGDSVYIASLAGATESGTANVGATVIVDRAGSTTTGGVSVVIVNKTDNVLTSAGNYLIEEGQEETFEITTTVTLPSAGQAGQYRAVLAGLDWATSDDATPDNTYTSNLDSFITSYVGLN